MDPQVGTDKRVSVDGCSTSISGGMAGGVRHALLTALINNGTRSQRFKLCVAVHHLLPHVAASERCWMQSEALKNPKILELGASDAADCVRLVPQTQLGAERQKRRTCRAFIA